jgi:hypothetical protein|tara:strand:- start:14420 stop:14812 length:393 start_codon:yes stop_codon:yes gene_type:complete
LLNTHELKFFNEVEWMYLSEDNEETAKYVITIKISDETPLTNWREIKKAIEKISDERCKQFMTSSDGRCAAFFVVSNLVARGIRSVLNGDTGMIRLSPLLAGDSIFVAEIDDENWTAMGFSTGWSWLQHQ